MSKDRFNARSMWLNYGWLDATTETLPLQVWAGAQQSACSTRSPRDSHAGGPRAPRGETRQSEAPRGADEETITTVKWTAQSTWQIGSQNTVQAFATTLHHISCLAFQTFFFFFSGYCSISSSCKNIHNLHLCDTSYKKSFHSHYHRWSSQIHIIRICQMRELKFREFKILTWNLYIIYISGAK